MQCFEQFVPKNIVRCINQVKLLLGSLSKKYLLDKKKRGIVGDELQQNIYGPMCFVLYLTQLKQIVLTNMTINEVTNSYVSQLLTVNKLKFQV